MACLNPATGARSGSSWRTLATILLVVVLALPAIRNRDGVPLSTYPMYARERSSIVEFVVPVGLDETGNELPLATRTIANTTDPLVAESFLRDAVRRSSVDDLCREIAGRVQDSAVVAVEIRTERHRVVDRALGTSSLVERDMVASCLVPPR